MPTEGSSEAVGRQSSVARLSVIVPTCDSARTIAGCLRSVRAQVNTDGTPFGLEVIVVDNSSTDATVVVAAQLADVVETWGPERSAQRNRGAALATAELVLFVDSDMVLDPFVCAEIVASLSVPGTGAVIVPEESFGEGFWAACRSLEKRIALGDVRTEAARGFRVAALREVGAWDETLTAAEDWELTDRLATSDWRIARIDSRLRHDEGRPTLRATFRKKRYYGQWLSLYLRRQATVATEAETAIPGVVSRRSRLSPLRVLARPGLLLRRPDLAAGLFALKSIDALGVGLGAAAATRERRRRAAPPRVVR